MSEKYQNKYRIPSNRKPGWDYSGDGYYFITLVTQNRVCNLGNIVQSTMILSDFGKIIEMEWLKSFEIRNELFLDKFILMPNHIHAIVVLDNQNRCDNDDVETHGRASLQSTTSFQSTTPFQSTIPFQSTTSFQSTSHQSPLLESLPDNLNGTIKRNPAIRLPKSISSFIAGFKSIINTKIDDYIDDNHLNLPKYNRNNHFFQPNYHDRIIRNHEEYERIQNYIANNPSNWKDDKFYE